MGIKKFKEYIAEGMWKSGLDRARSSTPRLEDAPDSNIYELKEVDLNLPFYVADDYLHIDGTMTHTLEDLEHHIKFIESTGWRIPTYEDLETIVDASQMKDITCGHFRADVFFIRSRYGDGEIKLGDTYMLAILGYTDKRGYYLTSDSNNELKICDSVWDSDRDRRLLRIKVLLIKDKK